MEFGILISAIPLPEKPQKECGLSFWRYQRQVQHEKLTEVSVSYFFRGHDYTVVMETLEMKYGTKIQKESNRDCKSYGTIDLSFRIAIG